MHYIIMHYIIMVENNQKIIDYRTIDIRNGKIDSNLTIS